MSRYHFNVYDGLSSLDVEGTEFSNWQAARLAAIQLAGEILKDDAARIDLGEDWRIEVTDHTGFVLFRLTLQVIEAAAVQQDGRHYS